MNIEAFFVETSYGGQDWKRENTPILTSIEDARRYISNHELCNETQVARILSEEDVVLAHFVRAYEGIQIDLMVPGWLEKIRHDYGVDLEVFRAECERWLGAAH